MPSISAAAGALMVVPAAMRINYRLPDPLRAPVVGTLVAVTWFNEEHFAA